MNKLSRWRFATLGVAAAATFLWIGPGHAQPRSSPATTGSDGRIALVIGNGAYHPASGIAPLRNPVNDARAMSSTLRNLGYEVIQAENLDRRGLQDAIHDFWIRAQRSSVRVFYYAGHAVTFERTNYLIPADADERWHSDIPLHSYDIDELVESLGDLRNGISIVVLDACRDRRYKSRGISRWKTNTPPRGTLIAFSTAAGGEARDGTPGSYGLYTKHLLSHLQRRPELLVEQLFKRVGADVAAESRRAQQPWIAAHLEGDFCFRQTADGQCLAVEQD